MLTEDARRNPNRSFLPTPVRVVLDAASTPAYTIGALAAGDPAGAAQSLFTLGQTGPKTTVSQALRKHGLMPGGTLGTILGLGADIVTDPLTYVSLGAGGAARSAASKAASASLTRAARQAARAGTRVPIRTATQAQAQVERAIADIPKAVGVKFRVPFTRGKEIPLGEFRAPKAAGRITSAIGSTRTGENLREVFLPAGAGSKAAHRIGQAARRAGDAEKRASSNQAAALQRRAARAAKAAGLSLDDAYRAVVRSIDKPGTYQVPEGLEGLRDETVALLDDLRRLEDEAGVERGLVPDYIPHLPASSAERRKLERLFPMDPDRSFFFQRPRELPDLDAWEAAGLKPEMNLARLFEVRAHASVDARVMRAFDEATKDIAPSTDIARIKEIMRPAISSHYAIEDTKRFVNAVGSSWKALALLTPGYAMRNLQSDALQAYWAGARNPQSFVQAARALMGKGSPIKIRGETYTPAELIAEAEAAGAIRLGQVGREIRGELSEAGGEKVRRPGLRPSRPGQGNLARISQTVNQAREDMTRLGLYIERRKAGDDVMTAAKVTRDFLFDYGDTGRFVRSARRFWLPFITFGSKVLPMAGRMVVQRPGTLANFYKGIQASNELAGNPDLSLLSPGQQSAFGIPAPNFLRQFIGAPEGQSLLYNPENVIALGALNQFDPSRPMRSVAGFVNPIPKAAVEGATDYSFYFGSQQSSRVKAPAVIAALAKLGVSIPVWGEKRVTYPPGSPSVPAYSRDLDLLLRIFPPFSQSAGLIPGGGSETTRLPYLRYFGGLSVTPYDQARALYYAEKYGRP